MDFKNVPYIVVLDVESVGLQGEAFAWGIVVIDTATREEVWSEAAACPAMRAAGTEEDRGWVWRNVCLNGIKVYNATRADQFKRPDLPTPHIDTTSCYTTPTGIVVAFWEKWNEWRSKGAWLAADVCYPVETNFLRAGARADFLGGWPPESPYPLLDIASIRYGAGFDPLATYDRIENERPVHHPVADARQSARLMLEVI